MFINMSRLRVTASGWERVTILRAWVESQECAEVAASEGEGGAELTVYLQMTLPVLMEPSRFSELDGMELAAP